MSEEISRAGRNGTPLACLLVTIGNLEELSREHGPELPARTLAYVSRALRPQLRDFDRLGRPSDRELVLVLPGADGPHAEVVARRVLERLRTIKIEADDGQYEKWEFRDAKTGSPFFRAKSGKTDTITVYLRKKK